MLMPRVNNVLETAEAEVYIFGKRFAQLLTLRTIV